MLLRMRCTDGPLKGEAITVERELILGRDVPGPGNLRRDPRLSRRHARIFADGDGSAVIEDLGSTNGTWVNEERLAEPRALSDHDQLRLGQSCFTVELPQPPAATAPDTGIVAKARTMGDQAVPAPCVQVIAGPAAGHELELGDGLLIGRSYGEPGALGGDARLSRRHARIARGAGGAFFIEDTGSTNGTLLNAQQLRGAHPLREGDEIKVGSSTLLAAHLPATFAAESPAIEPAGDARQVEPAVEVPAVDAPAIEAPAVGPAVAVPAIQAMVETQGEAPTRFSSRAVTAVFAGVFALAALAAAAVVLLAAPLGSRPCPPGFICHKPSTAPPLQALTTFAGSLGWRVEYDSQLAAPSKADTAGNQLVLQETARGDSILGTPPGSKALGIWIRAYPASRFSAPAAMQDMVNRLGSVLVGATAAPSSDQMFGIPVLGFHTATGEVVEGDARTPQGPGGPVKVAALSATSGTVTVVAAVFYGIRRGTSQGTNPNDVFDRFADTVLETVRFPGDGST